MPAKTIRFDDWEAEQMRDPEFVAAVAAIEPEMLAIKALHQIRSLALESITVGSDDYGNWGQVMVWCNKGLQQIAPGGLAAEAAKRAELEEFEKRHRLSNGE